MAKKELTRNQRIIAMITVVALLIYAIVNAFLVIFAYTKLSSNVQQLKDLANNWNEYTVLNIQVAATCPTGYESALSDRQWYGVDDGCWCGPSVDEDDLQLYNISCTPFCPYECSSRARTIGCDDVDGADAVSLSNWGSVSSSSRQICVERSTETWGNTGAAVNADGTCPSGYLKCGTSDDNVFCTQEAQCPITSISIESGASCGADPDCIVLDDGAVTSNPRVIKYQRGSTEDAVPLSEIRLNEDGMCNIVSEDEITPNRRNFPLLKTKLSTCDNEGGDRWTISGSMTETEVFQLNSLSSYISSLSGFTSNGMNNGYYETGKDGDDYEWRVFSRGYIPWALTCRNDLENFLDKANEVNKLKDAQLALLVIGLISTLIIGIILSWMEIQNLRGVDLTCIDGKGEEERAKLSLIKKILGYFFKFLVIPFQIWAILLTSKTKGTFNNVVERDCSNDLTNDMIFYFSTTLSSTYQSNIIGIAITVASLLFDIVMNVCKKDKKEVEGNMVSPAPNTGDRTELVKLNNNNQSQLNTPHEKSSNPFAKNEVSPNGFNNTSQQAPANNNNGGQTITINLSQPQAQPIQTQTQPQAQQNFGGNPFGQPPVQQQQQFQPQPQFQQQQQQQPQPFGQPPFQHQQQQQQQQFGGNPFQQQQQQQQQQQFGTNPFAQPRY